MQSRRRKSLGQHYLTDEAVIDLMVSNAQITKTDRVVEIGTGRGVVTKELCRVAEHVEGYEIDRENYEATDSLGLDRLTLHREDAFSAPRDFDVLVASLPYSESSNFVEWLAGLSYRRAIVLLQSDFVRKLLAVPGDEQYRAISVISQISSDVRVIRYVSRESFDPPPRVLSALVSIVPRRVLSTEQTRLIKILFSQRRKRFATAVRKLSLKFPEDSPTILSRRVEQLTPGEIGDLLSR
jgi:16S rRNA (adenine1518-N6/adenine1519-N6)-dimethyltransferase